MPWRVTETIRPTWDKVVLGRGLLEITGEVKNEYRRRVIPVADQVLRALDHTWRRREALRSKVRPVREHIILDSTGEPFRGYGSYSHNMRDGYRPGIRTSTGHRKTCETVLLTFGTAQGLWNAVWEQYLGHSPATVTTKHYVPRLGSVSDGEEDALERQMELFRLHVVAPLNRAIKGHSREDHIQLLYNSDALNV